MTDEKLKKMLKKLVLPPHRKDKLNKNNLFWLSKNLTKTNENNIILAVVLKEINRRIEEKIYLN